MTWSSSLHARKAGSKLKQPRKPGLHGRRRGDHMPSAASKDPWKNKDRLK